MELSKCVSHRAQKPGEFHSAKDSHSICINDTIYFVGKKREKLVVLLHSEDIQTSVVHKWKNEPGAVTTKPSALICKLHI